MGITPFDLKFFTLMMGGDSQPLEFNGQFNQKKSSQTKQKKPFNKISHSDTLSG